MCPSQNNFLVPPLTLQQVLCGPRRQKVVDLYSLIVCVNRAAVFICHGAGNHCQAQSKLASRLNDCNMLVFAHDHGEFIGWSIAVDIAQSTRATFLYPPSEWSLNTGRYNVFDSAPSLAGVCYLLSLTLSVCLSQTSLLLFCFSVESSHFLAISSPWQKLQNCFSSIFDLGPNAQNLLPKICMWVIESVIVCGSWSVGQRTLG